MAEGCLMFPLRVLLVDDHPVFLAGLRMLLEADPRIEVVGEANTGTEAVAMATQGQPDAVVMDLHLPDINGIAAVGTGTAVFGPSVAQRIIDYFATQRHATPAAPFPELTEREREILNLIAAGANNTSIAARLFLSIKTVRNHVSNIFSKLQVADRAQAIVRARKAGLGVD